MVPTGSVIGGQAITSMAWCAHWTRRRRRQIWPMNRPEPAAVGPERDHVVETIATAETCWNTVEARSCIIDRVTNHRGGIAIELDPNTGLRDGVGLVGVAATKISDSSTRGV